MSINLPFQNQAYPLVRVLTSPAFNLGAGQGGWTIQPMWSEKTTGLELINCSRVAIPATGEAQLRYRFGSIDGRMVGVQGAPATSATTAEAIDLAGYEIRIQMASAVAAGETPAWRTVWWGQCEYQKDMLLPGAEYPAGDRIYYCVDGFARTRRWMLNRHAAYVVATGFPGSTAGLDLSPGHPGYNVGQDGRAIGNKYNSGETVNPTGDTGGDAKCHTWQGSTDSDPWTDLEVIEHALRVTRPKGEPIMSVVGFDGTASATSGTTWLSDSKGPWPVNDGESAFDLVSRVCRSQRGRGSVFLVWADDVSAPTGTLSPRLVVTPQVVDDVVYAGAVALGASPPTPANVTLPGATTAGSTVDVDLIGDHRALPNAFRLGDRDQHRYDYVESYGEPIEVAVTLSYFDYDGVAGENNRSLEKRWTSAAETAFAALEGTARTDESWKYVWNLHGLPRQWGFVVADGDGGTSHRCDYRCDDSGTVGAVVVDAIRDTSPLMVQVLPDLPLFEGYDYTAATPVSKGGSSGGLDTGEPSRRPPMVLIRTTDDRYLKGEETSRALSLQVTRDGIYAYNSTEVNETGGRFVSDTGESSLGATYDYTALAFTVGIRLPHRVRIASYAEGKAATTAKRKLTIYHPDIHLWLVDAGCIWDLDAENRDSDGCPGRREAMAGTNGFPKASRDDRSRLVALHALAKSWYLVSRQTAQWGLKACGFLPSFESMTDPETEATEVIPYPTLGQLVRTMNAGGQVRELNTPITSVRYDHQSGETFWATDWAELDFK